MNTITIGIDLAKTSFSLVGMSKQGNITFRKTLTRKKLLPFIANHPISTIAMEACSGAHFWAREFSKLGHECKIIAAKFIAPFRKGVKNDNNDAEAICEAAQRPRIYTVPIKTPDQQALQAMHRIASLIIKEKNATVNQARGLLAEFGFVIPKGKKAFITQIPEILEDAENGLPDQARMLISHLLKHYKLLHEKTLEYDREFSRIGRENPKAKRLRTIPGVGDKTATGMVAAVPDPRMFTNSHQFAAWLGLTPKQFSTGGKIKLGGITKAGNSYLRMCLIHGARSYIKNIENKDDKVSRWIVNLIERRGYNRGLVAMAARNARLIWTLLIKEEDYRVPLCT